MSQFAPSKIWDFAECLELFNKALAEKRLALLRGAVDGITHEHQIRFLRPAADNETNGVWVELIAGDKRALELEFRQKVGVEVSFSLEDAMLFFDSVIEHRRLSLLFTRYLLLRAPNKMSVVQQRKDGRVWVPDNCPLLSRLAKVTVESPDHHSEAIIPGRVWDLSISGASMICPVNPNHVALRQDEKLQFAVQFEKLRVDRVASVCYARPLSSRSVRVGLQFVDTDSPALLPGDNEKGISPMQLLLNELQAANSRWKLYGSQAAKKAG
jgi:hypothetical protein